MSIKFAIVSNALPPESSGQGIALHRILAGVDEDSYILVSRASRYKDPDSKPATPSLPTRRVEVEDIYVRLGLAFLSRSYFVDDAISILSLAISLGRIFRAENCQIMVVCTGDLYLLPAAMVANKLYGVSYIPYIFDDYAYQWSGRRRIISKTMEPYIIRGASGLICVNYIMAEEYKERYGVDSEIIYNPCSGISGSALREKCDSGCEARIVYAGSLYGAHFDAMRNLVEAIKGMEEPKIYLDIYTEQQRQAKEAGIDGPQVRYHEYKENNQILSILEDADMLYLPMAFKSGLDHVIRTASPAKMSEYFSTGRPVLAHAPKGSFVLEYIRKHNCGVAIGENDPASLREAIRKVLADKEYVNEITANAKNRAKIDFDSDKMRSRFICYLETMAASGSGMGN